MTRARRMARWLAALAALSLAAPAQAQRADCPQATLEAAKALAERAAEFLAADGPAIAFPRFMDRRGGFVAGDLYVFVFDDDGILRASGGWPETVGARVGYDGDGGLYTRMRELALGAGKGWVEYDWYNPCSRAMEPKASYIIRVGGRGGNFILGVGAYGKPGA